MDTAAPGQMILGAIRKQAKQTVESNSVRAFFHGFCFSSYFQVPALNSCLGFLQRSIYALGYVSQINAFLPKLALVSVLITAIET